MIQIIHDIDLMTKINQYDVILIGTNTYHSMFNGIQRDIILNYPYVREMNLNTKYGDVTKLGNLLECVKENEPKITLLFIIRGYPYRKSKDEDYLDYSALEQCLKKVNKRYSNMKIGTTLLGCSRFDGNGNSERVIEMMNKYLTDCDVDVYDFYQKSRDEKQIETRKKELELKKISYDLYHQAVKKRKAEAEERFKKNGFARY